MAAGAVEGTGSALGRLAGVAAQLGVGGARAPLEELSRGVAGLSGQLGGQVGGPLTDRQVALADEIAAFCGGAVVASGARVIPATALSLAGPAGAVL